MPYSSKDKKASFLPASVEAISLIFKLTLFFWSVERILEKQKEGNKERDGGCHGGRVGASLEWVGGNFCTLNILK